MCAISDQPLGAEPRPATGSMLTGTFACHDQASTLGASASAKTLAKPVAVLDDALAPLQAGIGQAAESGEGGFGAKSFGGCRRP